MALHWDSTSCVPSEPVDDNDNNGRECMIWGSIAVDIGEVNEKNVDEWVFRFRFLERIGRGVALKPIPVELVRRWIGLKMNVHTETRKKWMKKQIDNLEDQVKFQIKTTPTSCV
jgi:hypothetical protein